MTSPQEPQRPFHMGCGCALPSAGFVLMLLTALLTYALIRRGGGFTPLWIVVAILVIATIALFLRVTVSRGRR